MAERWVNNDSAREMTRKYNNMADEVNRVTDMAIGINNRYVRLGPSEFQIEDDMEDSDGTG